MAYNYNLMYPNYLNNGNNFGYNQFPQVGNPTQQNLYFNPNQGKINTNLDSFPSFFVDNYEQVRQTSVAADGTPSIFISNVEDRFWLKKTNTETGRTVVKSFVFKEDTEEQNKGNKTIMENSQHAEQPKQENFITLESLQQILTPIVNEIDALKKNSNGKNIQKIVRSGENE